jgi:hypothetical protein
MATHTKSTTILLNTRPGDLPDARMVQNFHLVLLDRSIDEGNNDGCRNSIMKLRQIVNTVNTFTDVDTMLVLKNCQKNVIYFVPSFFITVLKEKCLAL